MTSTLLIVQIILSIAITISVLLQKSSSIGLGAYSGSNESMFGAKGPMGFLAKITFGLGLLFIINTLVLGYLYTQENNKSVVDTVKSEVPLSPEKAAAPAPQAPQAPVSTTPVAVPTAPQATPSVVPEAPTATTTEAQETPVKEENKTTAEAPQDEPAVDVATAKESTETPAAATTETTETNTTQESN